MTPGAEFFEKFWPPRNLCKDFATPGVRVRSLRHRGKAFKIGVQRSFKRAVASTRTAAEGLEHAE